MADFRANFTALSNWTISGITLYDLDEIPTVINDVELPVMFPRFDEDNFGSPALPVGYNDDQLRATLEFEHLCLIYPEGQAGGAAQIYPTAIDLIDEYLLEMAGDLFLSGLITSIKYIRIGSFTWLQTRYFGFSVGLKWVRTVTGV